MTLWRVPRLWSEQTAFIIGGGPSVTQEDIESLRGRNTIAVNMSYLSALWAPVLFYADQRWWDREFSERRDTLLGFRGAIVTTDSATTHERLYHLKRVVPESNRSGIAMQADTLAMERTSLQGALNLCYHLGARRIAMLGADNRDADNGRIHHHDEYPWVRHTESWGIKAKQMGYAAARLQELGVEVVNCSPVSTLPYWPIRPLNELLKEGW